MTHSTPMHARAYALAFSSIETHSSFGSLLCAKIGSPCRPNRTAGSVINALRGINIVFWGRIINVGI
eukprot:6190219-Pleurochrysis_carterae.AAC.1